MESKGLLEPFAHPTVQPPVLIDLQRGLEGGYDCRVEVGGGSSRQSWSRRSSIVASGKSISNTIADGLTSALTRPGYPPG